MSISVIDSVSLAFRRTEWMLFKPFDLRKWFVLGFCAFLAYLGGGGGGFSFPGGGGGGGGGGSPAEDIAAAKEWLSDNLHWLIPVVAIGIVVLLTIFIIFTWLRCRGKFMFLDGVVRNRGAVVEPWHKFRKPANSLFWFQILFMVCGWAAFLLIAAIGLAIAWGDIVSREFGVAAVAGIAISVVLFLATSLASFLIWQVLDDFVVPTMYLTGLRVWPAWGRFWREILRGHVGPIVLFYLMKIVLAMAVVGIVMLAACVTCCLASCLFSLPYLGTVILLPLSVFMRSYSLYFLQQFGPQWAVFPELAPGVPLAEINGGKI